MKKYTEGIVPFAVLAILLLASSPLAFASTLTVNLNPKTGVAKVDSVSTTKIVFTYPANSTASRYLGNVSSTLKLDGSFASDNSGVQELQGAFDHEDGQISVKNATVSVDYIAKGSTTELEITKQTNVTAWVSGVFREVNGTVKADLGWRSYVVNGPLDFEMGDGYMGYQSVDINEVGSTMQASLASRVIAAAFMFGGTSIWDRPTLNYSALNAPLSTWTKNYNSATNTTTFSKTISGSSTFTASLDYNGQSYSLSVTSDPSGVVSVQGYANAQGDSLVMATGPASSGVGLIAAGTVVAAVLGLVGYFVIRRGARPKTSLTY